MKHLILCLIIITATGVSTKHSQRLPASEDNCLQEDSPSLYETIQSVLGTFKGTTEPLIGEDNSHFNANPFIDYTPFNTGTAYNTNFFNTMMSEQATLSYHAKVMELQAYRSKQQQSAWSPSFDASGNLTNGYYGFGQETAQAIDYAYANPTELNPFMPNLSYYSGAQIVAPSTQLLIE